MITLVLTVALAAPAWQPGPKTDLALEAAFAVALAADVALTWDRQYHAGGPLREEANPLLGRRPSPDRLILYNVTGLVAHAAIAYLLPRPWRSLWQGGWIAAELTYAGANVMVGARIPL